jgi:hypothetical protein
LFSLNNISFFFSALTEDVGARARGSEIERLDSQFRANQLQLSALGEKISVLQADAEVHSLIKHRQQQLDEMANNALSQINSCADTVTELLQTEDPNFRMPSFNISTSDLGSIVQTAASASGAFSNCSLSCFRFPLQCNSTVFFQCSPESASVLPRSRLPERMPNVDVSNPEMKKRKPMPSPEFNRMPFPSTSAELYDLQLVLKQKEAATFQLHYILQSFFQNALLERIKTSSDDGPKMLALVQNTEHTSDVKLESVKQSIVKAEKKLKDLSAEEDLSEAAKRLMGFYFDKASTEKCCPVRTCLPPFDSLNRFSCSNHLVSNSLGLRPTNQRS